jgi:hypothetical protein
MWLFLAMITAPSWSVTTASCWLTSGSPTFLNYRKGLGTVGLLEVESGESQARIITL